MKLREYQQEAIDKIVASLNENGSSLVVMPTGTGKTVVFGHTIKRLLRPGKRAMVIAHREELVRQAAAKIEAITGLRPDIEMADSKADQGMFGRSRVVVASVQTLISGERMKRFDPREFGILITDEAHHAVSSSYCQIFDHMLSAGCRHLGVTATPDRADEQALGKIYEDAAYVYELPDAVHDGWLVPITQQMIRITGLDYSQVKITAGDLNQGDVARAQASESILQGMCDAIVQLSGNKRTIIFATPGKMSEAGDSFKISERVEEILNRHKPGQAVRIAQDTPKDIRRSLLQDYREGKFQYLVNVGVFTEGFDEPGIEVVAVMRPTKSRSLYAQMVGRGTRPLPGVVDGVDRAEDRRTAILNSAKPMVHVIDFAGNPGRHKLVTAVDILGGNYDEVVVERARKKVEQGQAINPSQALVDALKEIEDERQARERRAKVIGKAQFEAQLVNPFNVFDVHPARIRGWDSRRGASPKQVQLLGTFGIKADANMSMTHASQLIDECMRRKKNGLVDFNQAKKLKTMGLSGDMSIAKASTVLGGGNRLKEIAEQWKAMNGGSQ
jgi:superfamily II DNA or RNA helicase